MQNTVSNLPLPGNEPIYSYAPGTPERELLKAQLEKMQNETIEIPLIIGGAQLLAARDGDSAATTVSANSSGPTCCGGKPGCVGSASCPALAAKASACCSLAGVEKPTKDIIDTAVAAGSFKTLARALGEADLVASLKGDGPFTVFAPSDDAFAKLPDGAIEALLKDKDKLKAVLTYHVVPGKVTRAEVLKLKSAKTLQGKSLDISGCCPSSLRISGAKVAKADIHTPNGVIHVIDRVLLPD